MRKNFTILLIFLFSTGFFQEGFAQKSMLRYADQQWDLGNYHHSADVFSKAYGKKETYRSAKGAAQSYDRLKEFSQALDWWEKVMAFEDERTLEDAKSYLTAANFMGEFEESKQNLKSLGFDMAALVQQDNEMMFASFSGEESQGLVFADDLNIETASDYMGVKDADGNLYFVSDRVRSKEPKPVPGIRFDVRNKIYDRDIYDWTGREYLKIYRKDDSGTIQELEFDRDDFLHISDPSIANIEGEDIIFFSATRNIQKVKRNKNFTVHPEMYFGILEDGRVTGIKPLPFNDTFLYSVVTPFVDAESKRLYFSSDMEGSLGGFDIYQSDFTSDFVFSSPQNLGVAINGSENERDPYIYDGKLYYASDRQQGFGGFDIYSSEIGGNGDFSSPALLEAPVNSVRDDFAYRKFSKEEIYLSSNRMGNVGLDNIYRIMAESSRKLRVRVLDCNGDLVRDSELKVVADGGSSVDMKSKDAGEYLGELSAESDFRLSLSKNGYFGIEDSGITTKGMKSGVLKREYKLIRIPDNIVVYTDIIYYDLDKSEIRSDANEVLARVSELMNEYDFLSLKVSSHTDSRASDEYNQALSRRRAESILSDLQGSGIGQNRINLEWHGEEKPVTDCPDGVNCSEELHQLNRRSELLLSFGLNGNSEIPEEFIQDDWCNANLIVDKFQEETHIPIVYFDFDKYDIRLKHKMELERLILLLKSNGEISLKLEGHTDIWGSETYNQGLSEHRAEIVMQYLMDRGISEDRLDYEWFGKTKPVQDCVGEPCTPAMHQLNRRTEIKVK